MPIVKPFLRVILQNTGIRSGGAETVYFSAYTLQIFKATRRTALLSAGHVVFPAKFHTDHPGTAADLPIEPLNNMVGTDASPVFAGKITVGQRLLNPIFYLPGGLFLLHETRFLHHGFGLLPSSFLALVGMDCLEHLGHQFHLGTRNCGKHIAVKVNGLALYLSSGVWHEILP